MVRRHHTQDEIDKFERDVVARWPLLAAVIFMVLGAVIKNTQTQHLLHIVSQPFWVANLLLVGLFCFYIYAFAPPSETTASLQDAASKGVVAMAIGLMSEAGISVGPFWIVFALAFFLDGWGGGGEP